MNTKSLNTWQNLTIRLARASLEDKFNEANKQQTARFRRRLAVENENNPRKAIA